MRGVWAFTVDQFDVLVTPPELPLESIDCFELSFMQSTKFCINANDSSWNDTTFVWKDSHLGKYLLMRRNDHTMKLMELRPAKLRPEPNTEPFDGSLEGVPITAAFNWTKHGKEFVYFFAGRQLCRQEISTTDWVPMCDIEDIADLIDRSKDDPNYGSTDAPTDGSTDGPKDVLKEGTKDPKDDSFPLTLVIVLVLAFIVVVVILLIVFLWFYKTKLNEKPNEKPNEMPNEEMDEKPKSEPKAEQNAENEKTLKLDAVRSGGQ